MNLDIKKLEETLCLLMSASVKIRKKNNNLLIVETPFSFPDGDTYQIYIKEMNGGIRLSDMGHTLMHLSYDNNIDKFREGTRGIIFNQIKSEFFITEEEGEFYIDTPLEQLGANIFHMGQAITKLQSISFLHKHRVESTFYEDLEIQILKIISTEKIIKEYYCEKIEPSQTSKYYPIDYKIDGKRNPIFLFGIPNKDKARLTTIVLERLLREEVLFESILVFQEQKDIPREDIARLTNVGGEMIASLDAENDLRRKILQKIA